MWRKAKLIDVCEQIYAGGDAPKKNQLSKIKTQEFSIPIFSNGVKNNGLYGFTNYSRTDKPAITISARGTIGHIELRNEPFLPIVRLIVLEPDTSKIHINYLKLALLNCKIFSSGSSIPQLTVPMLKKLSISLPPLPEQERIVAKLDAAFAEIDEAVEVVQQQMLQTQSLQQQKIDRVFGVIVATRRHLTMYAT